MPCSPDEHLDEAIVDSWKINAAPWTAAVRGGQIASRELVTNQAVIDAISCIQPQTLLDIGCGEGWLCRAMAARRVNCLGLDAIAELIAQAQSLDAGGVYQTLRYEDLPRTRFEHRFDTIVCNFSLIGKAATESVFRAAPHLLNPGGTLLVQTLHPVAAGGDQPYADGWREGSWQGFSRAFSKPAPWYFRTLASWEVLFEQHGFVIEHRLEPSDTGTLQKLSLILGGRLTASNY